MEHMKMKWTTLVVMAALSFVAMFGLMYMMVDTFGNVYANLNQFYMATVMTAAMMFIEIGVMLSMYERKVATVTAGLSVVAFIIFFGFLRSQTAISDKEFLKSMIPHHGAALLMCKNAELKDSELKELCEAIVSSQQSQIDWMKAALDRTE